MTETPTTTDMHSAPTDTYETLIFYAGVMKYLIEGIDELARFQTVQSKMTDEMRNVLFMLISNRVAMKRQKILDVTPVLHPYHRLNPLFYHLSRTENSYYTTEDTLLVSKLRPQHHSPEFEELLARQREELSIQMARGGKSKGRDTAFERLWKEYNVRENEGKRQVLSRPVLNEISHRVLTELQPKERTTLMGSYARGDILAVLKLFNNRFPTGIPEDKLEKSSTPARATTAPLYNYNMSMEGTLERAINFRVDYTREYAKLEKLKQLVAHNPHNKEAARQYSELSQQVVSGQPFISLQKKFAEHMDLLNKLFRRKGAEEEAQQARAQVEEDMKRFAAICESTTTGTRQFAIELHEGSARQSNERDNVDSQAKGAIFVESRE